MKQGKFEVLGIMPADLPHAAIAAAVARSGGCGLLDLEFCRDELAAERNFAQLAAATAGSIGLRLTLDRAALAGRLLASTAGRTLTLIFAGSAEQQALAFERLMPDRGHRIVAEIIDAAMPAQLSYPHDALLAKGHESGGWVGADTSYILAQKLLGASADTLSTPIYLQGGIGIHTSAAARIMGAAGIVLDDQLLLLAESPLSEAQVSELARLNGAETRLFGELIERPCRIYARPGSAALKAADEDNRQVESGALDAAQWRSQLSTRLGWSVDAQTGETLLPLGQGIGVAAIYRRQYRSVGRLVQALLKASLQHIKSAADTSFLAPGGKLAASHGTRFPLAQGPMTRVSDSAEFAYQVSRHGALPFLALALMRGPQVLEMLQQTRALMTQELPHQLPWGVGMLGFVPHSLREEQCEAIWQCKPPFALIAGGRPDQAAEFEKRGIATYIHAPAPALLKMYIEQGAKRFVFEGRECGGHIGPLASFPLWEQMIEMLLAEVKPGKEADYHLLFAGGIHDAKSGAMLAALAAPLAARGFKVGALMGTAYLFTQEIVESGAIVSGFQAQALECGRTVNLETGPGHSTRCADTQFARDFYDTRRRLLRDGVSAEEMRDQLEDLNLGRLRVASKGVNRDMSGAIVSVDEAAQLAEGMYMIGQVATLRDRVLGIEELHRDVTEGAMAVLARHLADHAGDKPGIAAKPSDIAIIGLGTLLPKANDAEKYWENIIDQVCTITEVPKDRWDWKLYFDADRNARDKIYSRWGGFLDEIAFDPISYGIPPKSMKVIDPMQLLTLEVTRRALADAGYANGEFDRENTSIILGASGGLGDLGTQYAVRAELPRFVENPDDHVWERLPEWSEESFAGSLLNVAAGRVANRMDLGGLNFTVDAACASSLTAIAMAVNELESGRSNVAIAGGVDTVQSPFGFLCFSKTQALSPTGKPKTFDQSADGIAISEGLAVVVLKRLADAERDGDRIYAVIKAMAGSSDGKALGMTAPRPEGQKLALKRAYGRAGFSPATLGMAEAHGTGTPVGDRAEAKTITETLTAEGAAPKSVAISSVKTLIGHTKASAGVAGLMKVALSLHHRALPAHFGVDKPIDTIADANSPAYLLKDPRPWLRHPDFPRRGGVSAFGFGGTNFHAVLEEYQGSLAATGAAGGRRWPYELLVFRAKDEAALLADLGRFVTALRQGTNIRLRDLAYSLARQAEARRGSAFGLAVVAKDFAGAVADLEAVIATLGGGGNKPLPPSVRFGRKLDAEAPQISFLFPGQGAQYVNMGREAALYIEELRSALEFADVTLRAELPQLLSRLILPPAAFSANDEAAQSKALTDTRIAQPAIGAVSLGFLRFAERLGLRAVATAGHSYGEYTALHAAGVLSAEDFLKISAVRGRCMSAAAGSSAPGAMAAVQARREVVAAALEGLDGVKIANHNAPDQAVISGPAAGVEAAAGKLEAGGIRVSRLPVSGAFHTELVAGAQAGLSAAIHAASFNEPGCAVYSNTTGARYPSDIDGMRRTLDGHLLNSVEFVAEVEAMYAAGTRVFIELGPKSICSNMAKATLAGCGAQGPVDAIAVSLDGQGGGLRGLLLGLAELYAAGVPIALTRLFDNRDPQAIELSRLAELVQPIALPKHAWWISGGCARPLDDPMFRSGKLPQLDQAGIDAVRENAERAAARSALIEPSFASNPNATAPIQSAPISAPNFAFTTLPTGNLSSEAMLAYQQTMRQFLSLQERVIQQFLGATAGADGGLSPAMPMPMPTLPPAQISAAPARAPIAAMETLAAVQLPSMATPQRSENPAPVAFDAANILLEIVADRTGYPAEMLGFDQDLEAELGIDSIKRVEILGAFQKRLPGAAAEAMQNGMERYTRAKTLRAILEAAQGDVSACAVPANVTVTAATPSASAAQFDRISLTLLLSGIVADRTGYPEEMLGLDQDLEAELGIDSIKRVEILGALQKAFSAAQAASMQASMEAFTRARSLNAIVDAALALMTPENESFTPRSAAVPAVSPSQPAAISATDRSTIQGELLNVVAERTGYPAEMLGLDQDLEAELGIDSIKRVEILGALQKTLSPANAAAMQSVMENFTRARSLNAIVDAVMALAPAEVVSASTATMPDSASVPDRTETLTIPRHVPRARAVPLPAAREPIAGLYLLTADARNGTPDPVVAERLADRIVGIGGKAVIIPADVATDPQALASLIERIRKTQGSISGIVHLSPLARVYDEDVDGGRQRNAIDVKALFWLLQKAGADLAAQPSVALSASRLGGSLGREAGGSGSAASGAAVGLFNCAVAEWPSLRARLVDFEDSASADFIADALLDELAVMETRTEIGYRGGARIGFAHVLERIADNPFAPHLEPSGDWVVLITGGARGITAEIAEELARPGQRLILLGRTPFPGNESAETASLSEAGALKKKLLERALAAGHKPTPAEIERELRGINADREIRSNLARLAATGAIVDYRVCDVRDTAAFGALIDSLYANFGRIDAVLHGAGVIEDKRIADKTPDSFDRVFDTKVDSAFVMREKLKPEGLKLLAFFTSLAGRFGNVGQADYGAANETLNRLAWQLHREWPGVRVLSINWGPWDAGMATDAIRAGFRARGIEPIPVAAGRRFLIDEMRFGPRNDVELVAGAGPWSQVPLENDGPSPMANAAHRPNLPLVRRAPRIGAGGAVTLEHRLNVASDPYLLDHMMDGKPVLPAAVALEYMAQFVAAGWPEWQVAEMRDLRVLSGIVLEAPAENSDNGRDLVLRARASTHSEAGAQAVSVEILDPARKGFNYRATAILLPQLANAPHHQTHRLSQSSALEARRAYADYLFHGPGFQLLTDVLDISAQGIDAQVYQSSPQRLLGERALAAQWLFDPGLIDTGPQLAWIWARVHKDKSALPSRFGRVARYGTEPITGPLRAVFRLHAAPNDHALIYDVDYVDDQGRVRWSITDGESTMSAALNRLAGNR